MRRAVLSLFLLSSFVFSQSAVYSARDFVDSVGVNVHLHYQDTPYNQFDKLIKPKLVELGVRHVRDGAFTYEGISGDSFYYRRLRELVAEGVGLTLITSMDGNWTEATDLSLLPEVFDWTDGGVVAFEGINEPDIQGVDNWPQVTRASQQTLFEVVRSAPGLKNVMVIGPSPIFDIEPLGDLSAYLDYGNAHPYPGGKMPSGDENGQSTSRILERVSQVSGDAPIIVTETGYHSALKTDGGHLPTSERAIALYLPKLLLDNFSRGVPRTFIYEFLSTFPDAEANPEAAFGLLRNDGSETPAYQSVKRLLEVLGEGEALEPAPLSYTLQDRPDELREMLFQVTEDTYVLALWLERSAWDRRARQDIMNNPVPLGVTFPDQVELTQHVLDGAKESVSSGVANTDRAPNVLIGDAVTLLEITLR